MPRLIIKEHCAKHGISKYRLAMLLEMDQKNVARLFRPEYNPTFLTLARIAKVLRCKVRDLIKE